MDESWVYRQYDHQLFLNTVVAPGGDAALLRLAAPGVPAIPAEERRGLALSTDGNARWCSLDPRAGTALVVAESALNVACVGARPVALVNCLNFGNPEHPEVMWQLSESIDGMAEACRALSIPVIGGNVSLYNESRGRDIDPTPVVGMLGLVDRLQTCPPGIGLVAGSRLLVVGAVGRGQAAATSLAGSRWAVDLRGHRGGRLPALDLELHGRLLTLVRDLVAGPAHEPDAGGADPGAGALVDGVHDVSEGGLGVALAEMAVRSGVGFQVGQIPDHLGLFGEGPSRVVLSVAAPALAAVRARVDAAGVDCIELGSSGGDRLIIEGLVDLSLAEATVAWRDALPQAFDVVTNSGAP
jgi:phosphoribosylformylglycinamidine synthase